MRVRTERDSLGAREVPASAYYGIQTLRAVENFPVSGWRAHPRLVEAYVHQKRASALANRECGALPPRIAAAIVRACEEILAGKLRDQFVVDVFQAGAGVSQHMNVNEVLANRAIEILGGRRGDYARVHPNDHVNRGQSTNDTYPAAMRIATLTAARETDPALAALQRSLAAKGRRFRGVLKAGRTHLQDAVPILLGQEFDAWAAAVAKGRANLFQACRLLEEIGLGGTAVGTGLNAAPGYRRRALAHLRRSTGLGLRPAPDLREAMQSNLPMAAVAAAQRILALELERITNDLRLLASGPMNGLAEIRLPAVQPGSSIMPGKVNPAVLEMAAMVCFQIEGNALVVERAVAAGQLELNVMMPAMAFNVLTSFDLLRSMAQIVATRCIAGIEADRAKCRAYADRSPALVTALNARVGYDAGARVAARAIASGKSIREVAAATGILPAAELDRWLDPGRMVRPERQRRSR